MKIMSVRAPWAQLIVNHGKDVENRSTNIAGTYRGPVAIHVSKRQMPVGDRAWHVADAAGMDTDRWDGEPLNLGHIIGVVNLRNVHDLSEEAHGADEDSRPVECSKWAEWNGGTRWHLTLANPRALAEPIPYRGALGLRTLDEPTIARILEQLP